MPRATIPYDELQQELDKMFPWPTCRVRLRKPDRYNNLKAPVTVYDRTDGKFQRIGYRCNIFIEMFTGLADDLTTTEWDRRRMTVLVEL